MKSVKRVLWLVRGSCPQLEFERVLNLDEVEIVHKSYSTLLWTEWLSRLVVHREWVKFTMGVDFAKFWKMSKLERMQNKKEGSVLSMDLKGFWIWKRSTQSHFVWEGPMDHQPCFPPHVLSGSIQNNGAQNINPYQNPNKKKEELKTNVYSKAHSILTTSPQSHLP